MSPLSILMIVIIAAAIATWLVPSGQYDRLGYTEGPGFTYNKAGVDLSLPLTQQTLDSLKINIPLDNFTNGSIKKAVSVPGTYQQLKANRQSVLNVLQAPLKGIYESIDIILFVLVIGGFMQVFNKSGAMEKGIAVLSLKMKGKESWLIIILSFLFCFGGSSFGMAEEGLVFYPLLIPIFLAAGYDLLVPVAVIFAGTQMGTLSSFSNPFSTIIASNAAGVNWSDGFKERIGMFLLTSSILIWYIVRYANKIKKNPAKSLVARFQGSMPESAVLAATDNEQFASLDKRTSLLLFQFFASFLIMIIGVVFFKWWLLEMTTLFFASALLFAFSIRLKESDFVAQFTEGAAGLLSVALIIGTARGVTIILNEGNISDTIIYHAAGFAGSMPPALFIVVMLAMYMFFSLFISSSSGMAVLTMPIMGALAMLVNVPGREIVNAYLYGMGIIGFISPTGLILPSLALTHLSLKTWWHFIYPLLLILVGLCSIALVVGILVA
ncbi:MAG: YfcC family protein [Gloeobacteraceae cyanobacterium ES-bin-316]|nr:YfcC family protein [Ferruginibacter sp.]